MDWFACLNWSAISQVFIAGATVTLAIVAVKGLRAWKHPIGTKLKLQFMDDLIDAVHEYITAMSAPVQMVGFLAIEIQSYTQAEAGQGNIGANDGFIRFIEARGEKTGERFFQYLDKVRPIIAKIQSLGNKGHVLGFEGYEQASNACQMLIWSHSKIDALAGIISNPQWNWENQRVQENLDEYRDINSTEFQENLKQNLEEILEFAQNVYQKLLN